MANFNLRKQFNNRSLLSDSTSPAIMESIDSPSLIVNRHLLGDNIFNDGELQRPLVSLPDITLTTELTSLKLAPKSDDTSIKSVRSFLLLDGKEQLQVTAKEFISRLGYADTNVRVKVVSIFGNTGDGKSHTLNETFFSSGEGGAEVFRTSCEQDSCTLGVWAAYDPRLKVVCLDTEGLLGTTSHENQRMRLLLKVLAVSDIVIYRTRSERLHRDLFSFLGSASRAYSQHFQSALQSVGQRGEFGGVPLSALGPAVIVFHETRHTRTLNSSGSESAEDILRARFAQQSLETEAFSSVRYVGVRTQVPPTDFGSFRAAVATELANTAVRSPRGPGLIYATLRVLNDKFSGAMPSHSEALLFPDQYFTCPAVCLSCEKRCTKSMGHLNDATPHSGPANCRYQHQYANCTYVCKTCHTNGKEVIVSPQYSSSSETSWFGFAKYAWSGYVIECPNCGEIYRSRQFWYGNNTPEVSAVRTEIQHVWPGSSCPSQMAQNSAQRVLDGVTYISEAVASVGSQPTKYLSSWVADQVAPKYWRPNSEVKDCISCHCVFAVSQTKHHCRSCGEGVCEDCSTNNKPVPDRGWDYPVRVCDPCYKQLMGTEHGLQSADDEAEVRVRRVTEAVVSTLVTVASVLEYPKCLIKESARPAYWTPDAEVRECCVCAQSFALTRLALHHCRACGHGVCPGCSTSRRPVPHRGWASPVRVCDKCAAYD